MFSGVAAIAAGQMLNTLLSLILVPLYLAHWPVAVYGEWMALSSVVAYFALFDFGMNAAAANVMTAAYARQEVARFRMIQASAMVFYLCVAVAITIVVGVLAVCFRLPAWIGVRHIPARAAATRRRCPRSADSPWAPRSSPPTRSPASP